MGVLNVTPDSFSDGGRYLHPTAAVERGMQMIQEGADVVDVGGESSRPGAAPVPEDEELRRVLPVIGALAPHVRVSIDTMKPTVALRALEAGATLVNDISATLWPIAARMGAGWVAMHMAGTPATMQVSPHYDDVVAEVHGFLLDRASVAAEAGVREVWLDPGIGFGKTLEHNLDLLAGLTELASHGWPVLVGTSRKSFLGALSPERDGSPAPVESRLEASLATATHAMLAGARMVRVHDVAPTVHAASLVGPRSPADYPADGGASGSRKDAKPVGVDR